MNNNLKRLLRGIAGKLEMEMPDHASIRQPQGPRGFCRSTSNWRQWTICQGTGNTNVLQNTRIPLVPLSIPSSC